MESEFKEKITGIIILGSIFGGMIVYFFSNKEYLASSLMLGVLVYLIWFINKIMVSSKMPQR